MMIANQKTLRLVEQELNKSNPAIDAKRYKSNTLREAYEKAAFEYASNAIGSTSDTKLNAARHRKMLAAFAEYMLAFHDLAAAVGEVDIRVKRFIQQEAKA